MLQKIIISGRLEFGNAKTFEKVVKMYQQRMENFYRAAELIVKNEAIFDQDSSSINIPRLITQGTEKGLQNTVDLLEYISQFAIAGDLQAWMTDNGKVLKHFIVEPNSDKAAVQAFLKGRELVEEGKENEAREALSSAIEKYERHALAYERRGYVNFLLKNHKDAVYDFTKSIDLNPNNPEPYFGRAIVKMTQDDLKGAIADLENTIKRSIPLQPIYWKARRIKGECLLQLEDFAAAVTELKLCTAKAFGSEDSNYKWRQKAWFNYGKALSATGKHQEALQAFDQAMNIDDASKAVPESELLKYKELAQQKSGLKATA
ncbi:MAG: tetratricopeptide repeat protein [Saprospiraceae bacterium]|nr:tetratricopeptide repeat protein [Saprospiraceae bacterium]